MANVFKKTGEKAHDYWTIDDSRDFALLPAGTIDTSVLAPEAEVFNQDLPIRLKVGNNSFGQRHINKHLHWIKRHVPDEEDAPIASFLYKKLSHSGPIRSVPFEDRKINIMLRLQPGTLLSLLYWDHKVDGQFLSVVTMYFDPHDRVGNDGIELGRYQSEFRL